MATNWYIEATTFGNCNCDYNCPCQFELRPTHGGCRDSKLAGLSEAISAQSSSTAFTMQ